MLAKSRRKADVCLFLEGTYPYVSGGVSTWVHQTILALPDVQFCVIFIGSEFQEDAFYKYELPPNVVAVENIYLHAQEESVPRGTVDAGLVAGLLGHLRELVLERDPTKEASGVLGAARAIQQLGKQCNFFAFWKHPLVWQLLTEVYDRLAPEEAFLDFYYAVQALCEPVWNLTVGCNQVPPAGMYHSLCTGYAGFAAGIVSSSYESCFLLSEHGIYVRERIADLQKARWINDPPVLRASVLRHPAMLRSLWIEFFKVLGRFAYQTANYVTSLFEKNARAQVEFGAEPRRIEIIPNGIDIAAFYPLRGKRRAARQLAPRRMNVGFLGRVVPIKDVKTLIKAARLVVDELPEAQFILAGPMEEEGGYAEECEALTGHLDLTKNVKFVGSQKIGDFLPELDLMVLSSISEGLPFVILESFAAGIPIVSTDVGACRELIEGRPDEKPSFGPGGFVVPVGDSEMLAHAMIRILSDPALADQLGEAGRLRTEAHYSIDKVTKRYRQLYSLTPKDFSRTGLIAQAHQTTTETLKNTPK